MMDNNIITVLAILTGVSTFLMSHLENECKEIDKQRQKGVDSEKLKNEKMSITLRYFISVVMLNSFLLVSTIMAAVKLRISNWLDFSSKAPFLLLLILYVSVLALFSIRTLITIQKK